MLKRCGLALAGLFVFAQLALASGTIPLSMSQQFDTLGKPLSGCKLYIIQAGTTSTPQNAYQDSGLTTALPNPLSCDSAGRLPQFFLADGSIKVRLADKNGVNQTFPGGGPSGLDNILVIGPSGGGGGGGGTIDPTTILATGDLKVSYGTGTLAGFVRANGRTIGSATSGATERANADTQALFLYLWGADPNLVVSTGRGASAAADWAANKTIVLPDWRGRMLAGLDDMGSTAAGRLSSTYFGVSPTVLGAASTFLEYRTLLTGNLPPYTPSGSLTVTSTATNVAQGTLVRITPPGTGPTFYKVFDDTLSGTGSLTSTGTFTGNSQGGTSTPFSAIPPTMLATFYLKL